MSVSASFHPPHQKKKETDAPLSLCLVVLLLPWIQIKVVLDEIIRSRPSVASLAISHSKREYHQTCVCIGDLVSMTFNEKELAAATIFFPRILSMTSQPIVHQSSSLFFFRVYSLFWVSVDWDGPIG